MQKRSIAKKEVKIRFRTKLKRTAIVVFCLLFAYSAIYAADISTKKMMKKETENRYALRISIENGEMLRLDLAGTKHYLDVEDIMHCYNKISAKTKDIMVKVKAEGVNRIRSIKQ